MPKCQGCQKEVLFMKDENGTTQILDIKAPTYVVFKDILGQLTAKRATEVYVSHFATCPKASEFSRNKR